MAAAGSAACGVASPPVAPPEAATTAPATGPPLPAIPTSTEPDGETFARQRREMVARQIRARGVADPAMLAAMDGVPRHRFVPARYVAEAYADRALPIGEGQTISQPYVVALMTEQLGLRPGDRTQRVLEIGTGSGYQAAILAELTDEVYTIEIIPVLAERAMSTLLSLGYGPERVRVRQGDGYFGWPEAAPFDAIIVTAAPDHVPQPLVRQLKDGGRMVIPVGMPGAYQTLWRLEKRGDQLLSRNLGEVAFVPFTGAGRER